MNRRPPHNSGHERQIRSGPVVWQPWAPPRAAARSPRCRRCHRPHPTPWHRPRHRRHCFTTQAAALAPLEPALHHFLMHMLSHAAILRTILLLSLLHAVQHPDPGAQTRECRCPPASVPGSAQQNAHHRSAPSSNVRDAASANVCWVGPELMDDWQSCNAGGRHASLAPAEWTGATSQEVLFTPSASRSSIWRISAMPNASRRRRHM